MQTHLPLVLHPSPHRIAILGLGTGITASGGLFHPVGSITAVEMVPEVVAAAREHFHNENAGVLEDPRTRVIIDDARNFLRGTAKKFDVIVGDLVVPWRQGEGALFTLEHFQAAVFWQWLPLFQISEPELQILLRTFLSAFPRASVWRGDFSPIQPAIALVGGVAPFEFRASDIERRLCEMRPDPLNPQLSEPAAFWMYFIGVFETADLPPSESRVSREDRPWIELLGPLRHGGTEKEAFMIGRRFQAWAAEVKQRTASRSRILDTTGAAGFEAGELMLEFTLLLSEGDRTGARTVERRLQRLLPEQAFKKIFPEATAGGTPPGPLP